MNDPQADEHLTACVVAAQAGEVRARDDLVRALERPVLGFLRARGAAEPHDLANEVFIRVFQRLDAFEGNAAQFRAWVFRIARNLVIDAHRRDERRPRAVPTAPHELPNRPHATSVIELPDEDTDRVERLLEPLTEDQREVLLLRVVAGLSVDETAAVVDRNPGAVRALQHRGLARMRRSFTRHP